MRVILCAALFTGALAGTAAAQATSQTPVTPNMSGGAYNAAKDYQDGVDALASGQFREAAQSFDRLVRRGRPDATLYTLYGQALEGLKEDARAEGAFSKALELNPKQLLARRERALILVRLGRMSEARAELAILTAQMTACDDDCTQAYALDQAVRLVRAALTGAPPAG